MKKTLTLLILSICVLALLLKLNPSFRKAPTLKGIPYYEADTNQAQEVQPEVTQPKQVQVETIQPAQSLMGMACDFDNNQANDRGAMCEKCNRLFCVERNQIPDYKETTCPYCGQTQTLEFALNRGTYYLKQVIAQLQAQQQANQAAGLNNVIRGLKESSQRQSDYIQESIKNMPKFGGHHKSTTCRQGLGGTIECDTTER